MFTALTTDKWAGKQVYIIGGGPSLTGFDFNKLAGKFTVGCNKAAINANTNVMFTLDRVYATRSIKETTAFVRAGGEAIFAVPPNFPTEFVAHGVQYIRRLRHSGLSNDPREVYGLNSGYGALNLAYLQGAKEIYLLGFDMVGGHWHSGYAWGGAYSDQVKVAWARQFDEAAAQLVAAGVKVYNANPKSNIHTFPKITLEEACNR